MSIEMVSRNGPKKTFAIVDEDDMLVLNVDRMRDGTRLRKKVKGSSQVSFNALEFPSLGNKPTFATMAVARQPSMAKMPWSEMANKAKDLPLTNRRLPEVVEEEPIKAAESPSHGNGFMVTVARQPTMVKPVLSNIAYNNNDMPVSRQPSVMTIPEEIEEEHYEVIKPKPVVWSDAPIEGDPSWWS